MNFEQTIQAHTAALNRYCDLLEQGKQPPQAQADTAPMQPEPQPTAAAASKEPPQPQPQAETATASAPATATAESATEATADLHQVNNQLLKLVKAKGKEQVVEVLAQFGVKKTTELKEADYAGFITACDEALAA